MKTAHWPWRDLPTTIHHAVLATIFLMGFAETAVHAQVLSQPTVDTSFQPYEGARPPIAFQIDGKILVTGVSFLSQGVTQNGIARLNADGSLDTTFTPGNGTNPDSITSIAVQPDQKILVAGSFTNFSGKTAAGLVRLTANGSIDASFNYDGPPDVTKVVVTRSGDLLILNTGSDQIRRHAPDGITRHVLPRPIAAISASTETPPDYLVYQTRFGEGDVVAIEAAELPDGAVLGAYFILDNNGAKETYISERYDPSDNAYVNIYTYTAEGALKEGWTPINVVPATGLYHTYYGETEIINDMRTKLIVTTSGDFYVLGSAAGWHTNPPIIARYHSDGSLDNSFTGPQQAKRTIRSGGGYGYVNPSGCLYADERLLLSGGVFINPTYPNEQWQTVMLLPDGQIDPAFGIPSSAVANAVDPDALPPYSKKGATSANDRIFVYDSDTKRLIAYKPANTLTIAPEGALPGTLSVTTGKGVTLRAPTNAPAIKWQVSRDGGTTWTDLANDTIYQGVDTSTLTVTNATTTMAGERYRYVIATSRGHAASNATSLAVAPLLFPFPAALSVNSTGALYVGDTSLHTIQKVDPSGQVSLFAGVKGQTGASDGLSTSALFNQPGGLTVTTSGSLIVSDTANGTIRSITSGGAVSTLAGSSTNRGSTDGVGAVALFSAPVGVAQGPDGAFYVADSTNHTIRKITADGTVTTFAGTAGASGASDGTGATARFNQPTGITVDANGRVYVADTANNLIRSISSTGVVTTLAGVTAVSGAEDGPGGGALFNQPGGLAVDANGNVYVADTGNSAIRKITPGGTVSTLAGLPTVGGLKDGTGQEAWFNQPKALALSNDLYVADTGNAAIRKVTLGGIVTTLALAVEKPVITSHPASLSVTAGSNATFSVTASSALPITYQWQRDGTAVAGATTASYTINNITSNNAGTYTVVVSNDGGSVTSSPASLTITSSPPPTSNPPSSGGGGGGAPSVWFLGLLSLLAATRRFYHKDPTQVT